MPAKTARKNVEAEPELQVIPGSVPATKARDILGELLNRAQFGKERIPITDRERFKGAIIGQEDFDWLEEHKPRDVAPPSNAKIRREA